MTDRYSIDRQIVDIERQGGRRLMRFDFDYGGRTYRFRTYSDEDAIACRMRKYGTFYERDLLDYSKVLLNEIVPDDGLIVDIGANFGNHSVFWATQTDRHLVSIEANPELVPILTENLTGNADSERVTIVGGGAGETSARGRVKLSDRAPGQFGLAGVEVATVSEEDDTTFEIHPVPKWLARNGLLGRHVRLMKIDVEGAEIAVLKGAEAILKADRPEIFAEAATIEERDALDNALKPFGYRRVKRFCSTPTWHFSTITNPAVLWKLRCIGTATRVRWRYERLRHSVTKRLRPAA